VKKKKKKPQEVSIGTMGEWQTREAGKGKED